METKNVFAFSWEDAVSQLGTLTSMVFNCKSFGSQKLYVVYTSLPPGKQKYKTT